MRSKLDADPLSGDLFAFCNRLRNRLKILYFDQSGMWVFAKRLERGTFAWPEEPPGGGRIEMLYEELLLLLNGLDIAQITPRRWQRRRAS